MEDNKPRLSKKQIVYIVTAIAVLIGLVCSSNPVQQPEESSTAITDPPLVTSTSTEAEPIEETLSEEERNLIIKSTIDQTVSDWESGIIDYEEASTILSEIQDTCNPELADYAQAQQEYLAVKNNGNTLLELAQKFLGVKNYVQVLTKLNEIEQA